VGWFGVVTVQLLFALLNVFQNIRCGWRELCVRTLNSREINTGTCKFADIEHRVSFEAM
jgi:hypothetical protein